MLELCTSIDCRKLAYFYVETSRVNPSKVYIFLDLKVYRILQFFLICSIKSAQCTDKYSKKLFSIAIFLPCVLMYQKHQISLPVGYETARPKTGDWEQ